MAGVGVKSVNISWNTEGESSSLEHFWRSGTKARGEKGIRYPCIPSRKR